jgi:hypothetical protein
MQITIQKKYLILVEISENIFRVFLVIVNFVFTFVESKLEEVKENFNNFYKEALKKARKAFNFIRALFGFNIYKLEIIQIKTKTNFNNNFIKIRNQDFLIYSNLLAPPKIK